MADRYRVSLKSRIYLADDLYTTINVSKISDSRYLEDFEKRDFRLDPEPDNVIALTKRADNFTIDLVVRKQLNDFYDMTERLPELHFDTTTMNIGSSPFYYQGSASLGRLRRDFSNTSTLPDYQTTRFDTYHQIIYPNTYFGWLSVVPHVGVRGTYYSNSGEFADQTTVLTLDSLVPGEAPTKETVTTTVLNQNGAVFRPTVDAGIEASFKLSQTWDLVQNRTFGLDGLRHIFQPYTELSYVNTGKDPGGIFQYDRYNPSTEAFELSSLNSTAPIRWPTGASGAPVSTTASRPAATTRPSPGWS
ncbi:MAG: LPS assembly protein LptD [Chthoniobacteraceae bacterium]